MEATTPLCPIPSLDLSFTARVVREPNFQLLSNNLRDRLMRTAVARLFENRVIRLLEGTIPRFVRGTKEAVFPAALYVGDENIPNMSATEKTFTLVEKYLHEPVMLLLSFKTIVPCTPVHGTCRYFFKGCDSDHNTAVFIVGSPKSQNEVAVIPAQLLERQSKDDDSEYLYGEIDAHEDGPFPANWKPYVMSFQYLPEALESLIKFSRGELEAWMKPHSDQQLLAAPHKAQLVRCETTYLIPPSRQGGDQKFKLHQKIWRAFRDHSSYLKVVNRADGRDCIDYFTLVDKKVRTADQIHVNLVDVAILRGFYSFDKFDHIRTIFFQVDTFGRKVKEGLLAECCFFLFMLHGYPDSSESPVTQWETFLFFTGDIPWDQLKLVGNTYSWTPNDKSIFGNHHIQSCFEKAWVQRFEWFFYHNLQRRTLPPNPDHRRLTIFNMNILPLEFEHEKGSVRVNYLGYIMNNSYSTIREQAKENFAFYLMRNRPYIIQHASRAFLDIELLSETRVTGVCITCLHDPSIRCTNAYHVLDELTVTKEIQCSYPEAWSYYTRNRGLIT